MTIIHRVWFKELSIDKILIKYKKDCIRWILGTAMWFLANRGIWRRSVVRNNSRCSVNSFTNKWDLIESTQYFLQPILREKKVPCLDDLISCLDIYSAFKLPSIYNYSMSPFLLFVTYNIVTVHNFQHDNSGEFEMYPA